MLRNKLVPVKNVDLSKETVGALKGILACMVLISHLHGRVDLFDHSILGTAFSAFGYLAVSCFFCLSGYGLQESVKAKKDYNDTFLLNKVFPFFCMYCFSILIYIVRDLLCQYDIKIEQIIQSLLFGDTVVDNGWYLQTQLLFYVMFYCTSVFAGYKKLLYLIGAMVGYCVACAGLNLSTTWYEASFCFPLGIFFSMQKEKLCKQISWFAIFLIFTVFIVSLFLGNKKILPEEIRIVIKMMSAALFAMLVFFAVLKINIKNAATIFLGKYSFEIYVMQGIYLNLFKTQMPIMNEWIYMLMVVVCTLITSLLLHPIYTYLRGFPKRCKV